MFQVHVMLCSKFTFMLCYAQVHVQIMHVHVYIMFQVHVIFQVHVHTMFQVHVMFQVYVHAMLLVHDMF